MADKPERERTPAVKQAGSLVKCENGDVLLCGKMFAKVHDDAFWFFDRGSHSEVPVTLQDLAELIREA